MLNHFSKRFVKQLLFELADARLQNGAAALAFYSMLAIFPTAIFALSLLPYLPIPDLQRAIFDLLGELMPREAAQLFNDTVHKIVSERHTGLLSFGLLFGVWSATSGVLATLEQLDVVRREEHRRSSLRARGRAFLLLIPLSLLIVTTFGLVIFGGVLQAWIGGALGWSPVLIACFATFRWVVITAAILATIAFMYRVGPTRSRPFRLFSPGAIFATLWLMLISFAFRFYVNEFGSYDAVYGSLGAAIALLVWLFVAAWMFLMGAAIDELAREPAPRDGDVASEARHD
jgi:membrane protein